MFFFYKSALQDLGTAHCGFSLMCGFGHRQRPPTWTYITLTYVSLRQAKSQIYIPVNLVAARPTMNQHACAC